MRDEEEISGRRNRRLVAAKARKDGFGAKRQKAFLSALAASCNVKAAAAASGVCRKTVYVRRRADAAFRAAWFEALDEGYARLELLLLKRAGAAEPIDYEVADDPAEEPDTALARYLLGEHRKALAGTPHKGAPPHRGAEWSEVEEYFVAKLRALKVRIGRAPSTAPDQVRRGSPPPEGEEL